MLKLVLFALLSASLLSTLYPLSVRSVDGKDIVFSDYRGKKILIVNTATGSRLAARQLPELAQLQARYPDSLVVVAVPSNSFGGEAGSPDSIQGVMTTLGAHYLITEKMEVCGPAQAPLYRWLTHKSENEVMDSEVDGDFQKYLIGSDGRLLGYFVGAITPLDSLVLKTIEEKWKAAE